MCVLGPGTQFDHTFSFPTGFASRARSWKRWTMSSSICKAVAGAAAAPGLVPRMARSKEVQSTTSGGARLKDKFKESASKARISRQPEVTLVLRRTFGTRSLFVSPTLSTCTARQHALQGGVTRPFDGGLQRHQAFGPWQLSEVPKAPSLDGVSRAATHESRAK